jgi:Cu(I)/Ag(I) efflux system membrane fusion protein
MRVFSLLFILFIYSTPVIAAENYICPMHPHIHGEADATCPVCGMNLVLLEDNNDSNEHKGHIRAEDDSVKISIKPDFLHTLGIKTAEVSYHKFGQNIRAYGRVIPNTREEYRVDVRTEGWVTKLETDAVGDAVKKGDLLFNYYSPDLLISSSDFLLQTRGKKVFGDPALRLKLEGMDDIVISQLKEKGELIYEVPFHAPVDGTVSKLNVREGSYVKAGETLLVIDDFSTVWVRAEIPIKYMPFLKVGDQAMVTLPDIGRDFTAVIDFIHPVLNADSRTGMARLVLENTETLLHPDHYVDVVFSADIKSRLTVPEEAILYSANGAYVFESLGEGRFTPRIVETGITADGHTEIRSGLAQGQKIVTSGQFLLDAESNLKAGMKGMNHDH